MIKPANFGKNKNPGDLKQQIGDAGSELKQRAGEAFQASKDMARDKLAEATDAAQDVAKGAVEQLEDRTHEQQQSGAHHVDRLAGNFRQAASAFEKDVPFAARGITSAAAYVEEAAEKIRDGSLRDLLDGATDFAKRQPAAFLGISVLAGFAAVRFLKVSGASTSSSRTDASGGRASAARPSLQGGAS
ncbi:hypothetical protein [Bradyrhizobium sp.]|uniref:hypothetical protein n=1 Tax=Bradyrhizobium sp. TaxID=376 RepID=UPI00345DDD2F